MYNSLNEWLEITGELLHNCLNYSINEYENEIVKMLRMLRGIGNVPLTLGFLGFLTALYMLNVLLLYCKGYPSNRDTKISKHSSRDSPPVPDIFNEIHHYASRLRNKKYEERCLDLLEMCPEAINTPKAPFMYTPFLKACSFGNSEAVQYMIQKGADITAQTKDGETPLFLALWNLLKKEFWDDTCIEILYRAGCDVNAAKRHGYTPLHVAAKSGNINAIKWLLEHGADPFSLTQCRLRPIDYAVSEGHAEAAALLKTYS